MPPLLPPRGPEQTPVIVACRRTAVGRSDPSAGIFRRVRGDDLALAAVAAAVTDCGVAPETIDDVIVGATQQHGEFGGNLARRVALLAGLPFAVGGTTVNRADGSGLEVFLQAGRAIASGEAKVVVVAGVDHLHHEPASETATHPRLVARSSRGVLSRGLCADRLAAGAGISRRRQDAFAVESHRRAVGAARGVLDGIVPVVGLDPAGHPQEALEDQCVLLDASLAGFAELDPLFLPVEGSITAATSAPAADGAAAAVVMSAAEASRQGLRPLARVVAGLSIGVAPAATGMAAAEAASKLLDRAGIGTADLDAVALDEAFAAEALFAIDSLRLDAERVNVRGGALALGHPPAASGVIMVTRLVHSMAQRGDHIGMVTMGIGLGQGIALLLERWRD